MQRKLSVHGDYMRILRALLRSIRLLPADAAGLGFQEDQFITLLDDLSEAKLVYKNCLNPDSPEYLLCVQGIIAYTNSIE